MEPRPYDLPEYVACVGSWLRAAPVGFRRALADWDGTLIAPLWRLWCFLCLPLLAPVALLGSLYMAWRECRGDWPSGGVPS